MNNSQKPRVLITYIEAGMGHIVTAQAIADSLRKNYGDKIEIIDSYIMRDSDQQTLKNYEKYLIHEVHMHSTIPGYCRMQMTSMHLFGAKNTLKFVHSVVFRKQTNAIIEEYKKYNPDVIVLTHYFTLYAAVEYKRLHNPNVIVALYCPDNMIHGWWDNRADIVYTNNPLATRDAQRNKFLNILEVFYPTRADITASNESKEFYRNKFGIPKDKFAVVVADGAYAKGKAKSVTKALIKTKLPLTVCLLAGKNEKLKIKFDKLKDTLPPNVDLITFGYTKDAPQLYAACDLFITKAGPNAVLDSVMLGTPVLIDFFASPIEKATKKLFVDKQVCGYYCTSPSKIKRIVEGLINDPSPLDDIRDNLKFFDKTKNGADDIAKDIASRLKINVVDEALV